eukprot:13335394-Ditylum_brightwellii.AAC.1
MDSSVFFGDDDRTWRVLCTEDEAGDNSTICSCEIPGSFTENMNDWDFGEKKETLEMFPMEHIDIKNEKMTTRLYKPTLSLGFYMEDDRTSISFSESTDEKET